MFISENLVASTVPFQAPNGSVSLPGFSFAHDPDTGIYRSGTNQLSISCGDSERIRLGGALLVGYNAGTTRISFQRADALSTDGSNDFNVNNSMERLLLILAQILELLKLGIIQLLPLQILIFILQD
jgi:hypothetical protein